MTATTKFSMADLEAHLDPGPTASIGRSLGVTARTVWRWRSTGLTELQADRAAIAAGLHPGTVWDTWWATAA